MKLRCESLESKETLKFDSCTAPTVQDSGIMLEHLVNVLWVITGDVGWGLCCVCLDKRKSARLLDFMLGSCESKEMKVLKCGRQ
ncbi:unnamed protein product [Sphenostylis stenocarpa]|uniref:Uncharacterized protein n=1 Tax=Sphenostylis stenocarpa TaxID=92480 RepID=A0AA86SU52_9FABA|nr:unnamed protein product [Sphenostylis stenocarpa]